MIAPKLSLVIATYGRTVELSKLLDSLTEQKVFDFEVIVVDQNSDNRLDPTVDLARARGLNIIHLHHAVPDQGASRNAGLARATGKYIGFPDDDCWFQSNTVQEIINAFSGGEVDCVIGCWEESMRSPGKRHAVTWNSARTFRSLGPSMITQFYRTAVVREVGGFDLRLGLGRWFGGGEDTDLFFSVLAAENHCLYEPEIIVHHRFDESFGSSDSSFKARQKMRTRARGTGALYAKHSVPLYVVIRGLAAPILFALLKFKTRSFMLALQVSVGRLEGFIKWKFSEN